MSHYNYKFSHLFTAACLFASTAFIHAEESATTGSGSMEAIAETPFRTRDDYTGSTIIIYPSVLNEMRLVKGNFSALRFYTAPLCAIIVSEKFVTFSGRKPNETMYSFKMLNFHPKMEEQAMQYVTEQLKSSTEGKFTAAGGNISRLTHQQVTFNLPDFPDIKIDPKGTMRQDRSLNDKEQLNMYVPNNDKARFEAMVQAASLNLDVQIYYISKDVKMLSMSWSASDIRNTDSYKELETSGAAFVNARQLVQMVRETIQRKDIAVFQDPGVPEKLASIVSKMFFEFLDVQGSSAVFIRNQEEARKIEAEILAGTCLTAGQFQPIVNMWEVTNEIKNETDYKAANQKIQTYMKDRKERTKLATDVHFDASAEIDFGIFGGDSTTSVDVHYENEKTKHDVDQGYFASQDAFEKFYSEHHTEYGMEPRITPRGLNLVETQKFKNNLSITASAIAYYPVDKARQLGITGEFIKTPEKPVVVVTPPTPPVVVPPIVIPPTPLTPNDGTSNVLLKPFSIQQMTSGKCFHPAGGSPNPLNDTPLVLHDGCAGDLDGGDRLRFELLSNGSLRHITSGKCVHPKGGSAYPGNDTTLVLHDGCAGDPDGGDRLRFELFSNGSIRHITSGKCVHPKGGSAYPGNDTTLVLHDGCAGDPDGGDRLNFRFVE